LATTADSLFVADFQRNGNGAIYQIQAIPASGDFDNDGDVDGADFLAWQLGVAARYESRQPRRLGKQLWQPWGFSGQSKRARTNDLAATVDGSCLSQNCFRSAPFFTVALITNL